MGSSSAPLRSRIAVCDKGFLEDLEHWIRADRRAALKVLDLVQAVLRDPFTGIGKPEPLKHLEGKFWSRRITQEHRLVYRVLDDRIDFLTCRHHYY